MTSLGDSMEPLAILFLAIKQNVTHHVQAPFRLIVITNHCLFIFVESHMTPVLPLVSSPFLKIPRTKLPTLPSFALAFKSDC